MSTTISEHQARVYEYAKSKIGKWFTIHELAVDANIPEASAKAQATRFEELRLFERLRISPSHVFRMPESARRRDPQLVRRIEEALPVFNARRREWLRKEAAVVAEHDRPLMVYEAQVAPPPQQRSDADNALMMAPPPTAEFTGSRRAQPAMEMSRVSSVAKTPKIRKPDLLMQLLQRPNGASMEELIGEMGILPHSIRAQISITTRDRGVKAVLESGRYYVR